MERDKRKVLKKLESILVGRKGSGFKENGYFDIKRKSRNERRNALKNVVKANQNNYTLVIKRLNSLANIKKNSDPAFSKRVRADQKWLSKEKKNIDGE